MTLFLTALDVLLGLTLIATAARLLATNDLFQSIALFVAFGLFMTLAWVRLDAPNVALAEAGIGAGFTGALLLAAVARLMRLDERDRNGNGDHAQNKH